MMHRKQHWAVALAAAGAIVLSVAATPVTAQAKRRTIRGVTIDTFVRTAGATQEADEAVATTEPTTKAVATTGPATKPAKRVDAFLKAKFARTPQSVLAALSAKPSTQPATQPAQEAERFAQDVIAGQWDAVANTIGSFKDEDKDDAKKLYKYLIRELVSPSAGGSESGPANMPAGARASSPRSRPQPMPDGTQGGPGGGGQPYVLPQDVVALIELSPTDIEDEQVEQLAQLLARALSKANVVEPVVAKLEEGVHGLGGKTDDAARYRAGKLLAAAGRDLEAGKFLPAIKAGLHQNDPKLLELMSRHLMALASSAEKPEEPRGRAWELTQALITHPKVEPAMRDAAIARAMELWPLIDKPTESAWLKESFKQYQSQGLSVLASVATSTSQNITNRDTGARQKGLEQQRKLVDALFANPSADATAWSPVLNVLATVWLQEVDYTKNRTTPGQMAAQNRSRMYNPYGGYYEEMSSRSMSMNNNEPPPLEPEQLIEAAPTEPWLATLDPSLAVRCRAAVAEMNLKNDEPAKAMATIELLAPKNPKLARQLANSMLDAFARLWDPNSSQNRNYSSYSYYGPYGYMQSSGGNGIPLTHSAQSRNLVELAATLRKLEKLPLTEPLDEDKLASAFASAHSPAEVFRIEDIDAVFGKPEQIKPDVLVSVLQTMRQRLATGWRSPKVQQDQKTKRTDKEMEAEATRGYELLTSLVTKRLAAESDNWKLLMLQGSALFDWAEFDYGRQVEMATYTKRRDESFDMFHKASAVYVAKLPTMKESEQSSQVFQQWFNAALGASDLAALTRQATPSQSEIERIRTAIVSIPGDKAADKHMEGFGKWLSDGSQSLKPELKHRFMKAGLEVARDHPSADSARKLVQYYADLLNEIELFARVEGDPIIGHKKPFGLHISIRHTQAVGRESGGFNKYLTNQQTRGYYSSMYGGSNGPVNYRDDFEKKIRAALVERFDIKAVTWFDEKVEARPYGKPGWRETPLAFVLLQPKDASVDKVPPIPMDLDFYDRQSQVILPVSSQVILVDARPDNAPARPTEKVEVTQILDERDAGHGKLTLDIKANAKGILGDLDSLLDVTVPGFKVDKVDDQGLAVNSMDVDGDIVKPLTERSWLVTLSAAKDALTQARAGSASFKFPQPKSAEIKATYKRYADADVADVDPNVALKGLPLGTSRKWMWATIAAAIAIVAGVIAFVVRRARRKSKPELVQPYNVPEHVTPFTVIDLLKRIEHDGELGLSSDQRRQLTTEILQLQERYFAPHSNGDSATATSPTTPNLTYIATQWVRHAQRR
jgi:hypothetical protein